MLGAKGQRGFAAMAWVATHVFGLSVHAPAKRRRAKFGLGREDPLVLRVREHPSRPGPDVEGLLPRLTERIQDRQEQKSADDSRDRATDGRRLIFEFHFAIVRVSR